MRRSDCASLLALCAPVFACQFDASGLGPVDGGSDNSYECVCNCEGATGNEETPCAQSTDDVEESLASGFVLVDGMSIDLGESPSGTPQLVGLRFPSVGIPRNATILSAEIQFTTGTVTTDPAELQIQGEASDDAVPFTGDDGNVSARPRTVAEVSWNPPGWDVEGEDGPDQRTPDLSAIVKSIVDRDGWRAEHAMALLITGTGRRAAVAFDAESQAAPRLLIEYVEPDISVALPVCGPPAGETPSTHCETQVENSVRGLAATCNYPATCNCSATVDSEDFATECSEECTEVPVDSDCTNFDPVAGVTDATNAPGDEPICTVGSPLSHAMFGLRSTCEVAGTARLDVDGNKRTPDTAGVIQLEGEPCPGGSCLLGLEFDLDILQDLTFGNIFKSATFRDLAGVGHTLPGQEAVLAASGAATFAIGSTAVSGSGRRGSDRLGVAGTNGDVINLDVDWTTPAAMCALDGSLLGSVDPELARCEPEGPDANEVCEADADCTDDPACSDEVCNCIPVESADTTLAIDLAGPIVNQPPSADAGDDRTVECNVPGGAIFSLNASGSLDPDGNAASFAWFRGARTGPVEGLQPVITVLQALDTTVPHIFRIIDTLGQADEDAATATVEDTTAPVIACGSPSTITPPDAPTSFTGIAIDICDADPAVEITSFDCFMVAGNGKVIDKTGSCEVVIDGDTLTIVDSGGVGDHISWRVRAEDGSGNASIEDCEIEVVRQGGT